jgi:dihydropyrimidinase
LIKGGTVVNAHHQQVADVYIEDGIIVAVNPTITVFLSPIDSIQCSL